MPQEATTRSRAIRRTPYSASFGNGSFLMRRISRDTRFVISTGGENSWEEGLALVERSPVGLRILDSRLQMQSDLSEGHGRDRQTAQIESASLRALRCFERTGNKT